MKNASILLFGLIICFVSCNTNETKKETSDLKSEKNISQQKEYLIIEGENIWVRSEPSTGEVVMKLNSGDTCDLIQKAHFEEIRDMYDYWYEIRFEGKTGWVYGSQTNLKTGMSRAEVRQAGLLDDIHPLEEFFELYMNRDPEIKKYVYEGHGIAKLTNPGVMCGATIIDKVEFGSLSTSRLTKGIPSGDKCEIFPDADGVYYKIIDAKQLPYDTHMINESDFVSKPIEIPVQDPNAEFILVENIVEEMWVSTFYFVNYSGDYYLLCQSHCDCNA